MIATWIISGALAATILLLVVTPVLPTIVSATMVLVPLLAPAMTAFGLVAIGWLRVKNPAIAGPDPYPVEIGWLVVLSALVGGALLASRRRLPGYLVWFWLYIALVMVSALFTSQVLLISLMKAAVLVTGVTTVFIAVSALGEGQAAAERVGRILEITYLGVTLASLPLLAWPSVGFALNGTGFQSFVSQPQAFAVIYAPLVAWYVAYALVDRRRADLQGLLLCVVGVAVVLATDSRTGLLAVILGLLAAIIASALRGGRAARRGLAALFGIVAVVVAVVTLAGGTAVDWLVTFVVKSDQADLSVESALSSRALLLELGWANFQQNPVLGIGFGMPSLPSALSVAAVGPMGIPLSVPIEKGNGFLQVLEETGVVGASVLLVFLFRFAGAALRSGSAAMFSLWVGAISVNMGEAVLMSLGGVGLLTWLYMALATVGGNQPGQPGWLVLWRA